MCQMRGSSFRAPRHLFLHSGTFISLVFPQGQKINARACRGSCHRVRHTHTHTPEGAVMCSAMPSSIKSSPAPEEICLGLVFRCREFLKQTLSSRSGLAFTRHRPAGTAETAETAETASRVTAFETATFFPAVQTGRGESQRTQ